MVFPLVRLARDHRAEPRHPRDLHAGLDSEIVRTRASRLQKPRLFPASEPLAGRVTPDRKNLRLPCRKDWLWLAKRALLSWPGRSSRGERLKGKEGLPFWPSRSSPRASLSSSGSSRPPRRRQACPPATRSGWACARPRPPRVASAPTSSPSRTASFATSYCELGAGPHFRRRAECAACGHLQPHCGAVEAGGSGGGREMIGESRSLIRQGDS